MRFDNSFEVPLPPRDAWALLMDVPRIVPCLPGAELTEVLDARSFKGRIAVKLGPVALTFAGTARLEEVDDAAHRARVKAQGNDAKGRGGANAVASFSMSPAGQGTRVDITTELNLSGAVAQYGRGAGMIQEVAAQLIRQFAENLRGEIARSAPPLAAQDTAPAAPPPQAAKPIGGIGLVLRVLWGRLLRTLGLRR